ncbi:hypothetical protein [Haloglomus halophilum]|jgi:hypothetical protein|uniref:hypothetical protein n=1 Tax=Haloglomus halophilum TaxID=2962672 RepID=UPI0020C9D68E|nr:hypothetical protein [Haloglomus halophilum]
MRTEHPTSHRTTTVSSGKHRSRAALTVLALVALAPLAFVGALVAVGITATTGPLGAGVAAVALFTAPVLLPWVAVRGAVTAMEHRQTR